MKKIISFLLAFSIAVMGAGYIYAADANYSCDISLEGDNTTIKTGETISYEVKVSNIKAEDGIILFNAELDYDDNVFQCKFESGDDWNLTGTIENVVTLSRKDLMPNSEDQTIGKIVLKAKSDANEGKYTIGLKKIKFTMDRDQSFQVSDIYKKIEIKNNTSTEEKDEKQDKKQDTNPQESKDEEETNKKEQTEKQDQSTTKEKKEDTGKTEKQEEKVQTKTKVEDSNSSLPHTGISETVGIIVIISLIIIAVLFYKKYKNWKNV